MAVLMKETRIRNRPCILTGDDDQSNRLEVEDIVKDDADVADNFLYSICEICDICNEKLSESAIRRILRQRVNSVNLKFSPAVFLELLSFRGRKAISTAKSPQLN
jgi:hypothetical protein